MAEQHLDPFTQVYNALWTLVERNKNLQLLIQTGNRIKYNDPSELKLEIADADTPELSLLAGGGGFGEGQNSTQKTCSRDYIWILITGDIRINEKFNPIQFELFRSMSDWECVLCNLQWCNCRFVRDVQLISTDDNVLEAVLDRNIPGWSSMWTVRVFFQFPTQSLTIKE